MICARCSRTVGRPVYLGGMTFGTGCARKVRGPGQRAPRQEEQRPAVDPRQPDLFPEAAR